jgi:hypothetical protein
MVVRDGVKVWLSSVGRLFYEERGQVMYKVHIPTLPV